MREESLKNGYVGELAGYRIHGKTYDADMKEIKDDSHEKDCFCCRKDLLGTPHQALK